MNTHYKLRSIRRLLVVFIVCLFLSGLTAIPIDLELQFIRRSIPQANGFYEWIDRVLSGYAETKAKYPFLMYGYDWLAFAHFILALLFIGPYRDPVKNVWVIQFGMIASALVIPFAFIAGYFRGIPVGWSVIDCLFGIIGFWLLRVCLFRIQSMKDYESRSYYITQAELLSAARL
ncbi:MAG TPA: hypothetical protein VJT83_09240 [Chitinophagaceae bacterium]|nr:hypothetical protein [Chitinophagaceae bacterium]